ncbi:MAG: GAF domain-containing sensor histidine kinase [Deltaproteobacteria bacterium]
MSTPPEDSAPSPGELLLDVALQLGGELRLESLLPMILRSAAKVMAAERALFALVDNHGALQRIKLHNLEWAGPGNPLPVSEALIREALEKRHAVHADVGKGSQFAKHHSVQLNAIRFAVAQPIFVEGAVAAMLYIDSQVAAPREVTQRLELLEGLAALVSTAVRGSRLYEEQRYRAKLLAQMVHDFRAPLTVISTNAAMIEEEGSMDDPSLTNDIAGAADRMIHMINSTLELSRVDAGVATEKVAPLQLAVEVPAHVRQLDRVAGMQEVQLQCTAPKSLPEVRTIVDRVWIILDNLLFNAIKHSRQGSTIHVRLAVRGDAGPSSALHRRAGDAAHLFRHARPIRPEAGAKFVEVAVYNVGEPIPKELMPKLFEDYARGEKSNAAQPSTGLGLSIVDQCVRYLGGAVWVDSSTESATCFKFTLPTRVEATRAVRDDSL